MTSRPVVLVIGAPASGATALAEALRERMPDVDVVQEVDVRGVAVAVLTVSAAAQPTGSDHAVLGGVAAAAGGVVGAVTKIDVHRCWRGVRAHLSKRYPDVQWIGTAAAPSLGEPDVRALVDAIRAELEGSVVVRIGRLRACRSALVRGHRSARSRRATALRTGLHRERLTLGRYTRERCAGLRTEFRAIAAEMPRRSSALVEQRLRNAADELLRDVDARIDRRLADFADALGVPELAPTALPTAPHWDGPPAVSRRAERGLTLALGAGFGLGIAVAAGRVMAALAPWLSAAAQVAGALIGLLLTWWLVSTRELLHDRAVVDRWVCDLVGALRGVAEDRVAARLLDAEVHVGAVLEVGAAEESEGLAQRIALIDAELRALRDRS